MKVKDYLELEDELMEVRIVLIHREYSWARDWDETEHCYKFSDYRMEDICEKYPKDAVEEYLRRETKTHLEDLAFEEEEKKKSLV